MTSLQEAQLEVARLQRENQTTIPPLKVTSRVKLSMKNPRELLLTFTQLHQRPGCRCLSSRVSVSRNRYARQRQPANQPPNTQKRPADQLPNTQKRPAHQRSNTQKRPVNQLHNTQKRPADMCICLQQSPVEGIGVGLEEILDPASKVTSRVKLGME